MERRVLSANERMVVDLLLEHGSLSRVSLARATGLSKPATNDLVARLVDLGLLTAVGEVSSSRRGPNAMHYRAVTDLAYVAGVEMQPGHVHVALADLAGVPLVRLDLPRHGEDPAAHVAAAVRAAMDRAEVGVPQLHKVVVGTPGVVTPQGDVDFVSGHPEWHQGQRDRLAAALGCPVQLENDVNLAALAEAEHGRASDAESFTLLSLDEGIGAATVLGGTLLRGAHGYAGELGLAPVVLTADRVGVPETGFQSTLGTLALQRMLDDLGLADLTPEQVLAAPEEPGHRAEAMSAFREAVAHRTAAVVTTICTFVDPELVVLTGAVGIAGGERLSRLVEEHIRATSPLRVEVRPTGIDAAAVVTGALVLLIEELRHDVYGTPTVTAPVRAWPGRGGAP